MKASLALHTTSGELGITIVNNQGEKKSQTWDLGRELGKKLHQILTDFIKPLTWQDFQFMAVAKGPGSYTSTRIGVVTARTIAQQLHIPVYGISTLKSLAWQEFKNENSSPILVQMRANNQEVFGAIFEVKKEDILTTIVGDKLYNLEEWQNLVDQYHGKLVISPDKLGNNSESILSLATIKYEQECLNNVFSSWENLIPFYQ
ncbi:peptidase M22 glycoprotease [Cyanobacterium stanieri PCC 7202]|uniref:Peptidase M22 glycoprotease n=1 Tax=Cyanobacterium stanieri (strain ATCC 29140 / PCC 7202) TaxID=292563 RepID=K9YKM0_CYASC|nr:peptidase M22 glycoprotease [Cyanobacterium stanieri PCC 7202]